MAALFAERLARSIYLSGISLLLAILIALPLGIFQAVKRNSLGDNVATSAAFILYSMPVVLPRAHPHPGLRALVPHLRLRGEPVHQRSWIVIGDWHSMFLPVLTLTLITVANFSRYMRSSSIDVLAQDYIKVARAKGLPERLVLLRHMVRNASLPMITLIGLFLPALLAGNLIVETLFNYQGLGLLFYNSLQKEDYPVLLAYTLLGAVFVLLGNSRRGYRADRGGPADPAGLTGHAGRRPSWQHQQASLPPLDVTRAPEGGEVGPIQSGWRLALREFASNRLAVVGVGHPVVLRGLLLPRTALLPRGRAAGKPDQLPRPAGRRAPARHGRRTASTSSASS